jgi:cytochrome c-type biogenesis protein CcmH/NrfF
MASILNTTTMPRLNETNYLTWHVRMRVLLIRSELWSITSGKETTPDPKTASAATVESFASAQSRR